MTRRSVHAALALSILMATAGCATLPPPGVAPPPAPLGAFELTGRVGVRYQEQGFNGGVRWTHQGGRDEVWLTTPLGQAVARVNAIPGEVTLVTSDRKIWRAADASALTREALGWELPLDGLRYWVAGFSRPGREATTRRGEAGRLERLTQDGWKIEYTEYTVAGGHALPRTLIAARDGVEIRLTVDSWSLSP
ncbi:MAG: lipoprotein insertase outer membrane protein LolB [Pseudomonadota bacterium]